MCNNRGAGIADGHQLSTSRVYNNTIVNNYVAFGGIELFSQARVYNNICWSNEHDPGMGDDQIYIDPILSNPHLFYNCVQYGQGGDSAIYANPEFVNPSQGAGLLYNGYLADWSLLDTSPCVNRGTPDTTGLFIPEYDIEGNLRIYGNRIEMGAYENQNVWLNADNYSFPYSKVQVFPNPGHNFLTIISSEYPFRFELTDIHGVCVINQNFYEHTNTIRSERVESGLYFYKIFDGEHTLMSAGKWIKY